MDIGSSKHQTSVHQPGCWRDLLLQLGEGRPGVGGEPYRVEVCFPRCLCFWVLWLITRESRTSLTCTKYRDCGGLLTALITNMLLSRF